MWPSSSLNGKTKSLFISWKFGSIRKPKYLFCGWFVVLVRHLFQLIVLLKSDSNCLKDFMFFFESIKLQHHH